MAELAAYGGDKTEYSNNAGYDEKAEYEPRSGGNVNNEEREFGAVKRDLKSRHLQMIAIGGTIGTGIFLSSGGSVAAAGPLGALISYTIVGIMVFFIVTSLGEMSAYLPLPGAFTTFGSRFVDPSLGFGLGLGYAFQWIISVTIEVTSAGMILQFWWPNLQMWIPALVFIVILVGITLLGVKAFGELEYWLSMIKVLTCVVFIIVGILVDAGAVGGDTIGGRNWHIDGAPIVGDTPRDKAINIFSTCVWAFFSFGGTELVGITAGESSNPGKAVPKAIRQTFWRILLFYILSITVIGLVIPWTDPNLLNSVDASVNEAATIAPFTIVFVKANLPGMMPAIFGRVNSRGVPLYSLAFVTLIACIAFVADVVGTGVVFTWLVNLTGMSALLTWMSISFIHLRFRAAFEAQGHSLSELPYIAPLFPYSCYTSILLGIMIVVMEGYQAATADPFDAAGVVAVFVGAPVFFLSIIIWKFYHKTSIVPLTEVDFDTGRPTIIQGTSRAVEKEDPYAHLPFWKRAGHKILNIIA
ncbi:hypothetical protein BGZ79_009772 [Entomortierella chlamydospora]|nr:hypothetical protein BGZ79_009772 [Entomortierella chlamydospora]